jgi:hypothetical protein
LFFSNHASERVIEALGPIIPLLIVIGLAWQVGLILRSELRTKVGRESEKADSTILPGPTSGANRKP